MVQGGAMAPSAEAVRPYLDAIKSAIKENGRPVLMPSEFRTLYKNAVPGRIKHSDIEAALLEDGFIRRRTLRSDHYHDIERIELPFSSPTPYDYALSIRSGAYLSHSSAVHLHGLTDQQPRTIYVNKEQTAKPAPAGEITQESIDRAFSRPQRRSKYSFRIDDTQIVLVSGKATGNAGVIKDEHTGLRLTNKERTLIDIAVRPRYAGGVFQVINAYKSAVTEMSTDRLIDLLMRLDYRYPYHQAIGFYLERAGAEPATTNRLRALGIEFDFYLDYSMASPQYDDSWRVHYPLGV